MTETPEQFERRKEAARFIAEAPQGSEFEYSYDGYKWFDSDPVQAVGFLYNECGKVRLKPTPQKVLRPAWEVLKIETDRGRVRSNYARIMLDTGRDGYVLLDSLINAQGKEQSKIKSIEGMNPTDWPSDWFFTTPATPSSSRIEEFAAKVAGNWYASDIGVNIYDAVIKTAKEMGIS